MKRSVELVPLFKFSVPFDYHCKTAVSVRYLELLAKNMFCP